MAFSGLRTDKVRFPPSGVYGHVVKTNMRSTWENDVFFSVEIHE